MILLLFVIVGLLLCIGSFMTPSNSQIFLYHFSLDNQLRPCPASVRTNVFNHIAACIPGSKKNFARRIRKIKEQYEDRKVATVLEQLKQGKAC